VNIDSGLFVTVASFNSTLWVGGTNLSFSGSGSKEYGTSTGATNAAGNWTGTSITDILAINKFTVGDYGSGDRIILAGVTVSAGCVMASSGGAFSELGGVGNRVSGDAQDVIVWTDSDDVKHVTVVGDIALNGVSCLAADYVSGTWAELIDTSITLGETPTCLGTWAKQPNSILAGGDVNSFDDLAVANLLLYNIDDGFTSMRGNGDIGGTSAGTRRIGPGTTSG